MIIFYYMKPQEMVFGYTKTFSTCTQFFPHHGFDKQKVDQHKLPHLAHHVGKYSRHQVETHSIL